MLSQQYPQQKVTAARGKDVKLEAPALQRSLSKSATAEPSDGEHPSEYEHDFVHALSCSAATYLYELKPSNCGALGCLLSTT